MTDYHFEDQRPDEEVIFVSKRHPWVLSKVGFVGVFIVVVLVLLFSFLGFSKVTIIFLILAVISMILYGFYVWFVFNNYLYILTNQRIIIIEQNGIFSRGIVEAELDKIQNVTVEVKGLMKTFLNFGDILMRTAGTDPVIVLKSIDNPYVVQQKIVKFCKRISDDQISSQKEQNIIR